MWPILLRAFLSMISHHFCHFLAKDFVLALQMRKFLCTRKEVKFFYQVKQRFLSDYWNMVTIFSIVKAIYAWFFTLVPFFLVINYVSYQTRRERRSVCSSCPETCAITRARIHTRYNSPVRGKNRACKHYRQPCNRIYQIGNFFAAAKLVTVTFWFHNSALS